MTANSIRYKETGSYSSINVWFIQSKTSAIQASKDKGSLSEN